MFENISIVVAWSGAVSLKEIKRSIIARLFGWERNNARFISFPQRFPDIFLLFSLFYRHLVSEYRLVHVSHCTLQHHTNWHLHLTSSRFTTVSDFRLQVLHRDLQRFVVTSLLLHVLPNMPGNPKVLFSLQKSGEGSRKTSFLSMLIELLSFLTSFLFTNKTCSALRYLSLSFEPITSRGRIWRQQVWRLQLPVTPWHLHSLLRLNRTIC